jgi:hypothetical protein
MLTKMHGTRFLVRRVGPRLALLVLTSLTPAWGASGKTQAKAQTKVSGPSGPAAAQTSASSGAEKASEPEPEDEPLASEPVADEAAETPEATVAASPTPDAACACAGAKNPKHTVWVEFGVRWDNGNFSRSEQVGGNRDNQNDAVNSLGPLFNVGFLVRQNAHIGMGAQLGYGASYDLNNDDLLIGQLLDLQYVAEFSAPLSDKFSILGAPRGGLALVIPSGILQERIDSNQQAGYDTWSGPRYGFLLGFNAGVRYKVAPWFSLRATIGYSWTMLFLLDSKAEGATVSASQSWQVQASRVNGVLGVEMNF